MELGGSSLASLDRRSKYSRAVIPGVTNPHSQHLPTIAENGRTFPGSEQMGMCLVERLPEPELSSGNTQAPFPGLAGVT